MSDTMAVDSVKVGERRRKDLGDLTELKESVAKVGLLHPLVLRRSDLSLIAGERRLAVVKLLGWLTVPVRLVDGLDDAKLALVAERDENTCRKELLPSEAVAIGLALEELEKPKAKIRAAHKGVLIKKETVEKNFLNSQIESTKTEVPKRAPSQREDCRDSCVGVLRR